MVLETILYAGCPVAVLSDELVIVDMCADPESRDPSFKGIS
jgi:hypothetical protein